MVKKWIHFLKREDLLVDNGRSTDKAQKLVVLLFRNDYSSAGRNWTTHNIDYNTPTQSPYTVKRKSVGDIDDTARDQITKSNPPEKPKAIFVHTDRLHLINHPPDAPEKNSTTRTRPGPSHTTPHPRSKTHPQHRIQHPPLPTTTTTVQTKRITAEITGKADAEGQDDCVRHQKFVLDHQMANGNGLKGWTLTA